MHTTQPTPLVAHTQRNRSRCCRARRRSHPWYRRCPRNNAPPSSALPLAHAHALFRRGRRMWHLPGEAHQGYCEEVCYPSSIYLRHGTVIDGSLKTATPKSQPPMSTYPMQRLHLQSPARCRIAKPLLSTLPSTIPGRRFRQ